MKTTLKRICNFYDGIGYPIAVFFLVLIGHSTGADLVFFSILMASALLGCCLAHDLRFLFPVLFMGLFLLPPEHSPNVPAYSDFYAQPLPLTVLCIGFGMLFVGVAIFAFRNRRTAHRVPRRGMLIGLCLLSLALCLNGLFNSAYTLRNLLYAVSFPLVLVGLFLLFALFWRYKEDAIDHFVFCLFLAGMQIFFQLVFLYVSGGVAFADGKIIKESVVLGWGVWTTVGGMQAFLMPACFYFAAKHRYALFFYGCGLLQFLGTLLSQSRAALLVGAGTLALCMLGVSFFGRNRRICRWISLGVLLLGAAAVVVLREKLSSLLQGLFSGGFFADNGRFALWETAWNRFLANPIFGAGFYNSGIEQEWKIHVYPYFYHNTVLQMLGSTGIVGSLAYLFHRFQTVRAVIRKPTLCKGFLGISILSMLLFCMLDVLFFITYPLFFYTLMLLAMERSTAERISI